MLQQVVSEQIVKLLFKMPMAGFSTQINLPLTLMEINLQWKNRLLIFWCQPIKNSNLNTDDLWPECRNAARSTVWRELALWHLVDQVDMGQERLISVY